VLAWQFAGGARSIRPALWCVLRHEERLDRNLDGRTERTETVSAMFSSDALQFLYEGAAKAW